VIDATREYQSLDERRPLQCDMERDDRAIAHPE